MMRICCTAHVPHHVLHRRTMSCPAYTIHCSEIRQPQLDSLPILVVQVCRKPPVAFSANLAIDVSRTLPFAAVMHLAVAFWSFSFIASPVALSLSNTSQLYAPLYSLAEAMCKVRRVDCRRLDWARG